MLQETVALGFELGAGVRVDEKLPFSPVMSKAGPLTDTVKLLVTTMMAATLLKGSATLVAVSVRLAGESKICGAVKTPLALTVPQVNPAQPAPLSVHTTPVFGFPAEITLA
jgi:hypothetical protein